MPHLLLYSALWLFGNCFIALYMMNASNATSKLQTVRREKRAKPTRESFWGLKHPGSKSQPPQVPRVNARITGLINPYCIIRLFSKETHLLCQLGLEKILMMLELYHLKCASPSFIWKKLECSEQAIYFIKEDQGISQT